MKIHEQSREISDKKILFIGPYKNATLRIGQYLSPPLGIYRIKSYIEKKPGCIVDVIDLDLQGIDELYNRFNKETYDIIGLSLLQPTLANGIRLINKTRQLCPDAVIIAGGQGAVFNHELLLSETPLDIVVKGFGEFAVAELVQNIGSPEKVKGLFIRHGNGIIDTGTRRPYTYEELHNISVSYDFEKVPYEAYWAFMEKIYTKKHLKIMKNEDFLYTIRLMTSSHCPRKCVFCSSTNFLTQACGAQERLSLTADDIICMVNAAKSAHPGCRAIYFNDDDFLYDKSRIIRLCSLLKKINGLSFFCLSRVDNIDRELLGHMKEAGFKFIIYGVESFSEKILKDMEKKIKEPKKKSMDAIKATLEYGITPLMNIILFYPTSRLRDILETVEGCLDMVEHGARLTVYTYVEVYPGSKIMEDHPQDYLYTRHRISGKEFSIPDVILPNDPAINELAEKSIALREKLIAEILERYSWKGVVPHPLYGLALFLAVYRLCNLNIDRIEKMIDKIMLDEINLSRQISVAEKLEVSQNAA